MSKRESIILEALNIINESGVSGLTLPALFEAAKTGPGTFYHYFENRDDLIEAVFEYCSEVAWHQLVPMDDPENDPHVRFCEFCRNIFRAYREYPLELDFLYGYSFGYTVRYGEKVPTIPSLQILTSILAEAQRRKCIASSVSVITVSHVFRGMIASYYWASVFDTYQMSDEAAVKFAQSTWASINTCEKWKKMGCEIAQPCKSKRCAATSPLSFIMPTQTKCAL